MQTLRARPFMHFGAGIAVTVAAAWSLSSWQASASVRADESTFVSVSPARILDTRSDLGLPGPFVSAIPQDLRVTGNIADRQRRRGGRARRRDGRGAQRHRREP